MTANSHYYFSVDEVNRKSVADFMQLYGSRVFTPFRVALAEFLDLARTDTGATCALVVLEDMFQVVADKCDDRLEACAARCENASEWQAATQDEAEMAAIERRAKCDPGHEHWGIG